MSRFRPAL